MDEAPFRILDSLLGSPYLLVIENAIDSLESFSGKFDVKSYAKESDLASARVTLGNSSSEEWKIRSLEKLDRLIKGSSHH